MSELQVSVEEPPGATLVGDAVRLAVGAGGSALTVTVATAGGLEPPGPEQVNENVEFAVSAPVVREPLVASVPLQLPTAVHAVAWADDHVSVEAPPWATSVGAALSDAVGGALITMVTEEG